MIDDPLEVYEPPDVWTPEHILHRMKAAFLTLFVLHVQIGPARMKAAWPSVVYDYEDKLAQVSAMIAPDGSEETIDERYHRLSQQYQEWSQRNRQVPKSEITRMDESFSWPGRYLKEPIQITRWAKKRAQEIDRHGYESDQADVGIAMVFAEATKISKGLIRDRVIILREDVED